MISYEDLVYALSEWRARQGLPITAAAGAPAPRTAPPMAPPGAAPARTAAHAAVAAPAAQPAWTPDPAGQEMTYQSDDFAIEGELAEADAGEAMELDSVRPSTQPGFAGPPGTRR